MSKSDFVPREVAEQLQMDASIYGNGYAEQLEDGTWRRIDPMKIVVATIRNGGRVFSHSEKVYGTPAIQPKDADAKES